MSGIAIVVVSFAVSLFVLATLSAAGHLKRIADALETMAYEDDDGEPDEDDVSVVPRLVVKEPERYVS